MRPSQLLVLSLVSTFAIDSSVADTIVFEAVFDDPPYTPGGALAGQEGWFGGTNQVVQSAVTNGGNGAVQSDAFGFTGSNITNHSFSYSSISNPEQLVTIGVDFMTEGVNGGADNGVFWTTLALSGNTGFVTQARVRNNGDAVVGPGLTGPQIAYDGTWQRHELVLNFDTGEITAQLDGVAFDTIAMPVGLTDLTRISLGINGSGQNSNSTAYFDNLSVVSSTVPSPTALSAGALLGLGLIARRRRPSMG